MFLLNKVKERKLNFFIRYCVIGFVSISLELLLRKTLLNFNFNNILAILLPLAIGICFAFACNIKFNFNIPRYYYKKSFFYFSIISISSFTFQFLLSKIIFFQNFNYEITRFLISGIVFLIAYNFHIKYSFSKNKKVGVAIYLDDKENIQDIFSKVGYYPDYIHVDFVDETMNENISKPKFEKLSEIRQWWPNHKIESHIMSKRPLKYIDKLSEYSDVIYFHLEIEDKINKVRELIDSYKIKPGLVLHAMNKYENFENLINTYKEILVLCVEKPGESGQEFLDKSNKLIEEINHLKIRDKFNLCVDGAISQKNINKIECEKIVSASNVFKNENPKKQIINLQKLLNK
jgi:pentose-5-phosphate-3-epimerase